MSEVRPVRFDVAQFLASHGYAESIDLEPVPSRFRQPIREYLAQGVLPERPLRLLLEGNVAFCLFRYDLLDLGKVGEWLHDCLPGACWGSPDQVQTWVSFAQRNHAARVDAKWKRINDRSPNP